MKAFQHFVFIQTIETKIVFQLLFCKLASNTNCFVFVKNKRVIIFCFVSFFEKACAEYLDTAQAHCHKYTKLLQHEREQRQRLQDMVETLAQQHSKLEQAANAHTHRPSEFLFGFLFARITISVMLLL